MKALALIPVLALSGCMSLDKLLDEGLDKAGPADARITDIVCDRLTDEERNRYRATNFPTENGNYALRICAGDDIEEILGTLP